tara:strand:+ start:11489 stop:12979 length:1491 start_codon:yes stop_codon:yes gene_type:complete
MSRDLMAYALQFMKEKKQLEMQKEQNEAQNALDVIKLELQAEENEAQNTRKFTFDIMKNKELELQNLNKSLLQLANLSEQDVSSGIKQLSTDILEGGKANVKTMKSNIDTLDTRIANVQDAISNISAQQRDYDMMYDEYAGDNKILEGLEFQNLLAEGIARKGWKYGGAGAISVFNKVPKEQRAKMGLEMTGAIIKQEGLNETISAQYSMLQSMFERQKQTADKDSDPISWSEHAELNLSYQNPIDGKLTVPSDKVVEHLAAMAMDPDAESFLINIYQWPDERGGQEVRDLLTYNPKFKVLIQNIERAIGRKNQLLSEGKKDSNFYESIYDEWQFDSQGVSDITEAFAVFHQNRNKYTFDEQKEILKFISIDWNAGRPVDKDYEDFYYDFYGDPNDPNAPYRQKERLKNLGVKTDDLGTKRYYNVDGIRYEYGGNNIGSVTTTIDGEDIETFAAGHFTETAGNKSLSELIEEKEREDARKELEENIWQMGATPPML